jgi:signal peptidase II
MFNIILIVIIAAGILLDQLSKLLVYFLMEEGDTVKLIPKVFHIEYVQNEGAAFGMLSDNRWVFMIISVIGIIGLSIYLFKFCKEAKPIKVGLALVISGGIGNMIDRTVLGFVVDMLQLTFLGDLFPWVFNVADSMVCIGIGLVILWLVKEIIDDARKNKKSKDGDTSPEKVNENENN